VLLTAGHCTAPDGADVPARAQVWFDEHIVLNPPTGYNVGGGYLGTPYTFPDYNGAAPGKGLVGFSYGDVGVVVLDQPVPTSVVPADRYVLLPTADLVDTLASGTVLDQVGYGVSEQVMAYPGENPFDRWTGPRDRMFAPSAFVSGHERMAGDQLKHSSNPGGGKGGTCFGDSGGPIFNGGTNVVLAVNSYVTNSNCAGVAYATRVDLQARLDWINGFVAGNLTCTFAASDSAYYNGPTSSAPLYGNGPVTFTWSGGVVLSGTWNEIAPPTTGTVYYNVVASGTVSTAGVVTLHFDRTLPNLHSFDAGGTLTDGHFVGWADGSPGSYLWTADGTKTCH
jgi:hypothetical protein